MKKMIFFLFIVATTKIAAQNNDYLVSMDGIGAIKIDMKQEELEKLLNKKIPLTNPFDTISGAWYDSAKIKYNNMELRLEFQRTYTAENNFYMRITDMQTNSPLCRTKSGIGIGSDKLKIITAYENNTLIMGPDAEEGGNSKTRYTISVKDNEYERMIIFHLVNKKVASIEVATSFNDVE